MQLPAPVPIGKWASRVDTLPGSYSAVSYPVEMHDSLLIVSDRIENLLWRINVRAGTREPFARRGGGPGEYARAGGVQRVHRDTVAMLNATPYISLSPLIDVSTGRGRSIRFLKDADTTDVNQRFSILLTTPQLAVTDTLGNAYGAHLFMPVTTDSVTGGRLKPEPYTDTAIVVRVSMESGRHDTLAHLYRGRVSKKPVWDVDATMVSELGLGPYGPFNDWHVTADGTLITVDGAAYQVRARRINQSDSTTFTLPWAPVAVSDSGWDRYTAERTRGSIGAAQKSLNEISAKLGRQMGGPKPWRYSIPEKPATLPPVNFSDGSRRMMSSGSIVWIPVHRSEPPRVQYYDLVDYADGNRVTTLELPVNQSLVAVTELGAYVIARDEDDLQQILLYRRRAN